MLLARADEVIDRSRKSSTVSTCSATMKSFASVNLHLLAQFNGFDPRSFSFRDLREALATVDVCVLSPNYGEGGEDFGKFFRREILPRLGLKKGGPDVMELRGVSEGMENLSANSILHMLTANSTASGLNVQWAFNDVEEGGWAKRNDFVKLVDRVARFLVVTEGSSDAAVIGKALP